MTIFRRGRRNFLKGVAASGGAALFAGRGIAPAWPVTPRASDVRGLREKVDHIVVIFQENRSFDHYFGAYQAASGASVEGLLDRHGHIDDRFTGLQKSATGAPYKYLPLPYTVPGFARGLLENRPFHLAPYMPPGDNVPLDPMHHFFRMVAQIDHGRMDRFVALALPGRPASFGLGHSLDSVQSLLLESTPCGAVLGFYTRADLPIYHRLADEYVLFDQFFQAMAGGSTGNALYLVAGRSAQTSKPPETHVGGPRPAVFDGVYDRHGILINDAPPSQGPTETFMGPIDLAPPPEEQSYPNIGDRLSSAGISWAWYNEGWNAVKPWALKTAFGPGDGSVVIDTPEGYLPHHNPFQYFPSWFSNVKAGHMRDSDDFLDDVRRGQLPSVCFLKATGSHDEHPANSAPQWGEHWVIGLLRALGESPLWEKTLVVVTYDEGGGYWDHVPPPTPDAYGCGTRVPALLVSPWARRGYVDHRVTDTTAIPALIEARFALPPLQQRDAAAYNLLDGVDFSQRPRAPSFG